MIYFQEHLNFVGTDESLGPLLLSVKSENVASQEHMRLLLRLQSGTMHELVPSSVATAAPHNMVKVNTFTTPLYHRARVSTFHAYRSPTQHSQGTHLITSYRYEPLLSELTAAPHNMNTIKHLHHKPSY